MDICSGRANVLIPSMVKAARVKEKTLAIIVENINTYEKYILLGAGLGMFKATRPSYFGGNLFPHEEESMEQIVAVSNQAGDILFIDKNLVKIVEIDGMSLGDMEDVFLSENHIEESSLFKCPGCEKRVLDSDLECPNCGLRLR